MKFYRCIAIIAAIFLVAVLGLATADVLPKQVPEIQFFTTDSVIDVVGVTSEKTAADWRVGDAGLDALPNATGAGNNIKSGSIGFASYYDMLMSNGGQFNEVKSFSIDTRGKSAGLYNIETYKILTYTSQNGSHLMGEESYVLDVAGNWSKGLDGIICVFSQASNAVVPAFCNKVTAASKMRSVTTAQIETEGHLLGVRGATGAATVPAALVYMIAVSPDANSASGFADGIISTTFTVSVMEGRSDGAIRNSTGGIVTGAPYGTGPVYALDNYDQLASTLNYVDVATVAGGISSFVKSFNYQSTTNCANCG